MNIEFEKNIPIPENSKREGKYTFLNRMESGDSFVVPKGMKVSSIRQAASKEKIKLKFRKYLTGEVRCWKV